ncbi:MAG: hypothetical protein AB7N76_35170 [Planctomycetota bacterium]
MSVRAGAAVRARLKHLLVAEKLRRIELVARELEELERERAEVDQRIPLWDRVLVFDVTPDEERVRGIDLALEPRRRVLRELREELEVDLRQVGEEFPPFGLGVEVERCFALARARLEPGGEVEASTSGRVRRVRAWAVAREALCGALEEVSRRIIGTWVPDFDAGALFERLADEERCRREAARDPGHVPAHPRLGVTPLTQDQLAPRVARRLLEGDFFPALVRLAAARAERDRLAAEREAAAGKVSFLERLNVFSHGRSQAAAGASAERLRAADEELRRSFERTRGLLYAALAAYPPLAVHQRVAEAIGVTSLLRLERVVALDARGRPCEEEVVAPRALVLAALRRLLEAFEEAFPEVPLPLSVTADLSDVGARPRSPRELLQRAFFERLEAGWSPDLRDEALEHAALSANLARRRDAVRETMSIKDRVLFRGAAIARQERLGERRAWHEEMAGERWRQLLAAATATCGTLAPLAARDLALAAHAGLAELKTEGGESRAPRACGLFGRAAPLSALRAIHRALGDHYGLRGGRADLLAAVIAQEAPGEEPEAKPFEPMSWEELLTRLAARLAGGELRARWEALQPRLGELAALEREVETLGERCGAWDLARLGGLALEEPERAALAAERAALDPALWGELEAVDRLLDEALDVYPPARLFYDLAPVVLRVEAIRAEGRERTIEVAGRAELRYECALIGQAAAAAALRRWCATLVATYGELPHVHDLLSAWELRGLHEQGWCDPA